MTDEEKKSDMLFYKNKLNEIKKLDADLFVLDEALNAVRTGLIEEKILLEFLEEKKDKEIVLTGRGRITSILDKADYITEMKKIVHPFDRGIKAREGIEY